MNGYQFNEFWRVLCRNFNQDEESKRMKLKEEDYFSSFKYIHPKDFREAINKLIEDTDRLERKKGYESFPTVAELRQYAKLSQTNFSTKKYNHCLACENTGRVTIILGRKTGDDKIYSRHFHMPGIKLSLSNKQKTMEKAYYDLPKHDRPKNINHIGIGYYDYSMHCRCDLGRAIKNQSSPGASITPGEYEDLLDLNKKKVL